MRLFSPDLLRNFSLGFLIGALLVAGAHAWGRGEPLTPPAHAAAMLGTLGPAAESVLPPAGRGP
jgi:hypothetical protein